MLRVLMNHFGSASADIIKLVKEYGDVHITYISHNANMAVENEADTFILEKMDSISDVDEYIEALLLKCIEHKADILVPYYKMEYICKQQSKFEDKGIKVFAPEDFNLFYTLNDKGATYELLKDCVPECFCEYYIVNTVEDFEAKYREIRSKGKEVCVKYVTDVASNSFRILNDTGYSVGDLGFKSSNRASYLRHCMNYEDYLNILKGEEVLKDIMVMEFLNGSEISCDCLSLGKGDNLIIPRMKINAQTQAIVKEPKIMDLCNRILDYMDYDTPCNIQFKLNNGVPMLLEINTRMSGGVMIASWATSNNIPLIAVCKKMGIPYDKYINRDWEDCYMVLRKAYDRTPMTRSLSEFWV